MISHGSQSKQIFRGDIQEPIYRHINMSSLSKLFTIIENAP